jgi:hypothetical protein
VIFSSTSNDPPINVSLLIPRPPETTNAPVDVLVDCVVPRMLTRDILVTLAILIVSAFPNIFAELILVFSKLNVPVEDDIIFVALTVAIPVEVVNLKSPLTSTLIFVSLLKFSFPYCKVIRGAASFHAKLSLTSIPAYHLRFALFLVISQESAISPAPACVNLKCPPVVFSPELF